MNIKTYLAKSGETQSSFAAKVGCTQGAVWQWINGRTSPSPLMAVRIEAATEGKITRYQLCPEVFGGEQ